MKIKLSESILSEMIQKAVTKVLKEGIYDGYTEAGDNGDSSELSQYMSSVENDLNMQAKYNDGSYNDSIISTSEAIAIANKAGQIVLDAKDAIMEVAYIYDEDDVPMYKIEDILAEYDMTMDDLNEIEDSNPTFESKSPKVIKVKMNELRQVIAQIIKEEMTSNDSEPFVVNGVYSVSNAGGYEIMLSRSGDAAKVRDAYGTENSKVSNWLEIEYVPSEGEIEGEDGFELVIDPNGYNIPLNKVMKVNS